MFFPQLNETVFFRGGDSPAPGVFRHAASLLEQFEILTVKTIFPFVESLGSETEMPTG